MKRITVEFYDSSDTYKIVSMSNTKALHLGRKLVRKEVDCLIADPNFDITIVAGRELLNAK